MSATLNLIGVCWQLTRVWHFLPSLRQIQQTRLFIRHSRTWKLRRVLIEIADCEISGSHLNIVCDLYKIAVAFIEAFMLRPCFCIDVHSVFKNFLETVFAL